MQHVTIRQLTHVTQIIPLLLYFDAITFFSHLSIQKQEGVKFVLQVVVCQIQFLELVLLVFIWFFINTISALHIQLRCSKTWFWRTKNPNKGFGRVEAVTQFIERCMQIRHNRFVVSNLILYICNIKSGSVEPHIVLRASIVAFIMASHGWRWRYLFSFEFSESVGRHCSSYKIWFFSILY